MSKYEHMERWELCNRIEELEKILREKTDGYSDFAAQHIAAYREVAERVRELEAELAELEKADGRDINN